MVFVYPKMVFGYLKMVFGYPKMFFTVQKWFSAILKWLFIYRNVVCCTNIMFGTQKIFFCGVVYYLVLLHIGKYKTSITPKPNLAQLLTLIRKLI